MDVIDDIIAGLDGDCVVKEVYSCAHWTAVKTRNWGLASSILESHPYHGIVRNAGILRGLAALELAEYARSDNTHEASIGIATINSMIDIDDDDCVVENALDVLLEKGRGKRVAVIGHFPWVPKLKEVAREFWVIEQRQRDDDLSADTAEKVLPKVDIVGITGTSLINHTFVRLMELCQGSFVVMIGPSSPMSPALFKYGVNVISGARVVQPERMLACITEGAIFRQVEGVKLVSMRKRAEENKNRGERT
ncbi:MAG TPA: DUF364 domain-containing protein [Dehalococcoidia bacterium]|nr:DUF364 domain-containing protein [Dehalococcoidia bacterium]